MNPILACGAVSASIVVALVSPSTEVTDSRPDQKTAAASAPIAEIYDPQEGPFIVRLNANSQVVPDSIGVIENAVASWSGPKLQAFQICFAARGKIDWNAVQIAMDTVSHELKAKGARVVTMPNGGLCRAAYRPNSSGAYVEINGVVNL